LSSGLGPLIIAWGEDCGQTSPQAAFNKRVRGDEGERERAAHAAMS
jgi:hypothetical protein